MYEGDYFVKSIYNYMLIKPQRWLCLNEYFNYVYKFIIYVIKKTC